MLVLQIPSTSGALVIKLSWVICQNVFCQSGSEGSCGGVHCVYLCSKQVWCKYHEELCPEHEESTKAVSGASDLVGAFTSPGLVALCASSG